MRRKLMRHDEYGGGEMKGVIIIAVIIGFLLWAFIMPYMKSHPMPAPVITTKVISVR